MRAIKFRIWNKKLNVWHQRDINLFGEVVALGAILSPEENLELYKKTYTTSLDMLNDLVAIQFTGLHDKNGKEVFEKDIIAIDEGGLEQYRGIVEWDNEQFCYLVKILPTSSLDQEMLYEWDECKIIGNIYENKDLLETK